MARFLALGLACTCAFFLLASGVATAADVALVIGNRNYKSAPAARSAEIDARTIADALADGGYDVTLGIDLNRQRMRRLLQRFARKMRSADKLVIYYSGHALRSGGVTYLAPVDQRNNSLVGVMMDGVPLDLLLRLAERRSGRAVVFIDAAQLNGYTPNSLAEPGLARIDPGQGVLVVSAAAPGHAVRRRGARGSRFADQVLRKFLTPRARAMDAAGSLRRPAWYTGSVRPRLRLIGRRGHRGRVGSGRSPAEIEAALGLTRGQRRDVQENLSLLGYDPHGIDGLFGLGTRTAVRHWQRANNLTDTGYLTGEQLTLLNDQARGAGGNRPSGNRPPGERDDHYWDRTGARGSADGYRDYLGRYSDGRHAADARRALKRIARAGSDSAARRELDDWRAAERRDRARDYRGYMDQYPTGIWLPEAEDRLAELTDGHGQRGRRRRDDPAADEAALGLTRDDRLSIEQRLNYLGFPPGPQDGFFDSSSRWAIEGYQRDRGFEPTGYLSQPVVSRILDETRNVSPGVILGTEILRGILNGN